ncbi:hypothetical protein [Hymenobacter negativus]|uniref:DUF7832 domain-containing protein n=1 Tax=Hymenobacter negativus TaxID=2795026 RepID=A0ABS3QDY9_9BACT|nr:hypothetical protein [Hymenobacter negativus]MBO2009447.1 hypothetical protein [Hymenobacter negativus]
MAIDRADWHHGGDFPNDLPDENGGTHIGMYLAWIINNYLEGEIHHEDEASEQLLTQVRNREITGRDFLSQACDEKFWESDLNAEGLAFTQQYYVTQGSGPTYFEDYIAALAEELPSIYHVKDTWENYDILSKRLDRRFREWKAGTADA